MITWGLDHADPHEHIWNIIDVLGPFTFKNISQKLVYLRLFLFFLMGEATKSFVELPKDSITTGDELTTSFYKRFLLQ